MSEKRRNGTTYPGVYINLAKIGNDLPVAYACRTLNSNETNYSVIEKELAAIVWTVKPFRFYVFGKPKFTIVIVHKPLQWLISSKGLNSILVR